MALFEESASKPLTDNVTYFGETDSRGQRVRFGIRDEDRTRHMYVIGQTGMGKSVLLENMAVQDIQNGNGLCFIDPHGSAIDVLLDYIPEHRVKDVIYFAPFDLEHPISFNVMEDIGPDKRHLVAQGLLSAFKKIWGEETFSARMEHIVNNTLLALLEYPGTTILSMTRMLTERAYRDRVVEHISEPSVKAFWINEFGAWDDRYQKEAAAGVLNKVSQFVSNPLIRNIVGQPKSTFDFRDAMDNQKIVLVNLSKGQVGEENSKLLGAMITTKVYLAAMSRADVSQSAMKQLPYFYLYVDEFQTVVNDSFESILSEARKYRLSLIIAHQYIEQLPELVQAAVFGNVGTRINFRVGATDAEYLEKSFGEKFLSSDIVNLSRFQVYLILMIDGVGSQPFSARTLAPIDLPAKSYRDEVINMSRKLYAGSRKKIEADIVAWMFDSADETQKKREKNRRKKSNKRARERGEPIPDRTGRGSSSSHAKQGGSEHKSTKPDNKNNKGPQTVEAPIEDLPGASNFKDAFANLNTEESGQSSDTTERVSVTETPFQKTITPDALRPDTNTYSVGAALRKKKDDHATNKAIHETGVVTPQSNSANKFAFTFDETSLTSEQKEKQDAPQQKNKSEKNPPKKKTSPEKQPKKQVENSNRIKRGKGNSDLTNLLKNISE